MQFTVWTNTSEIDGAAHMTVLNIVPRYKLNDEKHEDFEKCRGNPVSGYEA